MRVLYPDFFSFFSFFSPLSLPYFPHLLLLFHLICLSSPLSSYKIYDMFKVDLFFSNMLFLLSVFLILPRFTLFIYSSTSFSFYLLSSILQTSFLHSFFILSSLLSPLTSLLSPPSFSPPLRIDVSGHPVWNSLLLVPFEDVPLTYK